MELVPPEPADEACEGAHRDAVLPVPRHRRVHGPVDMDGYSHRGGLSKGLEGPEAGDDDIHHHHVRPEGDRVFGLLHDLIGTGGDVHGIEHLAPGLVLHLSEACHHLRHTLLHGAEGLVGEGLVVLDQVNAAHGGLVGHVSRVIGREADLRLDDGPHVGAVRGAHESADAPDPEPRPGEGDQGPGEVHVQEPDRGELPEAEEVPCHDREVLRDVPGLEDLGRVPDLHQVMSLSGDDLHHLPVQPADVPGPCSDIGPGARRLLLGDPPRRLLRGRPLLGPEGIGCEHIRHADHT